MDVDKLVDCIQKRIALWDFKSKDYHNRERVKKLWEEVASEMNEKVPAVKSRWRNLRDVFRKEYMKCKSTKRCKWIHFEKLLFLKDHLQGKELTKYQRQQISALDPLQEFKIEEVSTVKEEDFNISESDLSLDAYVPSKRGSDDEDYDDEEELPLKRIKFNTTKCDTTVVTEHHHNPNDNNITLDDSDYHFLMSLLPLMRRLPTIRKMQMRMKIQKLFLEEEQMKANNYQVS